MSISRLTSISLLALALAATAQVTFALDWTITGNTTYNLINESSFPIHYGVAPLYENKGSIRQSNSSGVGSISVTPGNAQPALNNTTGGVGTGSYLLPATNGATASVIKVDGTWYYDYYDHGGVNDERHKFHGLTYVLQFSWDNDLTTLFFNGQVGAGSPTLKVSMTSRAIRSTDTQKVIPCLTGDHFLTIPVKNTAYNWAETITFYNAPHTCPAV